MKHIIQKIFLIIAEILARLKISYFIQLATKIRYQQHEESANAIPTNFLGDQHATVLERIGNDGYAVIQDFYSRAKCEQLRQTIETLIKENSKYTHQGSDLRIFGAENLSAEILEFHNDPMGIDLANSYWETPVSPAFTLAAKMPYSSGNKGSGEGWHRDSFFCQFKFILYLSDVEPENGPFQYLAGSHKLTSVLSDIKSGNLSYMQSRITEQQVAQILASSNERLMTFSAPAGTLIIADTSGIHRGKPIEKGIRYALTNYYFPNSSFGPWMDAKFNLVPRKG